MPCMFAMHLFYNMLLYYLNESKQLCEVDITIMKMKKLRKN